ncbi:MAG TPA: hypothetical protein H9870_00680 [Candidatus Corynebacterium avicola]|uniref:Uncharacterized protein n=1 Tax=Candidatus Corynebacterium avicola TaxID=2838527 RepID=A0A9D1RM88_9CORY|nr:hypothetical protein [Candidatus Corynebacterium avicola]
MTLSTLQKRTKSTGARLSAAAVALLAVTALTACGGDDSSDGDTTAAATTDAVASGAEGADSAAGAELSEVLQDYQTKAEELGYEDCMASPDPATGMTGLACFGTENPELDPFNLYDREEAGSGEEVAEKALETLLDADEIGSMTRETSGNYYRPVDGDDVAGTCTDTAQKCEKVIGDLGLEIGLLDGALSEEEREERAAEESDRIAEEERAKAEKEEAERQEELQTYSGWDDLDAAKEQLSAWGVSCSEDSDREGEVAFCKLDSVVVAYDTGIDELEEEGLFREVDRDTMVSVSDDDWTVMCSPGADDVCDLVAEKTGKSVKDEV